jgi:hypothetical protein
MKKLAETNTLAYLSSASVATKKVVKTLTTEANVIQLFTAVVYEFSYKARVVIPGSLFLSYLMFVDKARTLPSIRTPVNCFTCVGSGLTRKN